MYPVRNIGIFDAFSVLRNAVRGRVGALCDYWRTRRSSNPTAHVDDDAEYDEDESDDDDNDNDDGESSSGGGDENGSDADDSDHGYRRAGALRYYDVTDGVPDTRAAACTTSGRNSIVYDRDGNAAAVAPAGNAHGHAAGNASVALGQRGASASCGIVDLESEPQQPNAASAHETPHGLSGGTGKPLSGLPCAVCLENVSRPSATKCGHLFCEECITHAVRQMRMCPLCRTPLTMRSVHPLYI